MRNLHLMWMDSKFNTRLAEVLNLYFPLECNFFVWRTPQTFPPDLDNGTVDASLFTVERINDLAKEWDHIFLHSLWLTENDIIKLTDEAASKIIWVVWGHDLYRRLPSVKFSLHSVVYYCYKWLQLNTPLFSSKRRNVDKKIAKFHSIAIGFPYDETYIIKTFGKNVPVDFGPYFSKDSNKESLVRLREIRQKTPHTETNILLGHCGAEFIQHEKYLKKLSAYKNEQIHIYLVMSYLASHQRIAEIRQLAQSIFREDQFTIITESMPQAEYFVFLTKMDVAIFPFKHQSALSNTKRLAFVGTKLYFDPRGVLSKGFLAAGVRTFDCRKIGRIPFERFKEPVLPPDKNAELFQSFEIERCVSAWRKLLMQ